MNKSELLQRLAWRFPTLSPADVRISVDLLLATMAGALSAEQRVEIRGFGVFSVHYRPARQGRNPKSGTPVLVPPKRAPHFKAGKDLREKVDILGSPDPRRG